MYHESSGAAEPIDKNADAFTGNYISQQSMNAPVLEMMLQTLKC